MSQLVARILLALFVVPLGLVAYFVAMTAFMMNSGSPDQVLGVVSTGLTTWGFVAVYWMLLWWRQIRWSSSRKGATLLVIPAAVAVGAVIGGIIGIGTREKILGYGFASFVTPLAWLMGTILAWRETKSERAARLSHTSNDAITCPVCGYNLTGLSEPRCPECGTKYTLTELYSRQPSRATAAQDKEMAG